MKHLIAIAAITLVAGGSAFGGTADFSPSVVNVNAGTDAVFEITITGASAFDAADLVIGAYDVAGLTFEYNNETDGWRDKFAVVNPDPADYYTSMFGYSHAAAVGGANAPTPVSSVVLGTVTLDTTGMADGDYVVQIDFDTDDYSQLYLGGVSENVSGFGTIHIPIPEPASLLLLGLGVLGTLRRRRS